MFTGGRDFSSYQIVLLKWCLANLRVKIKMSLPPERINIKRRRQDDPVEALRKHASGGISSC